MPYIYSLAGKTYHQDYTIMRALAMDFGTDTKVLNIGDQFMFGPSLMVSPVYEYKALKRQVYLPSSSNWYDLSTGKFYTGGQTVQADAPISKIPVFVKEGSIIPVGPDIQYAVEKPAGAITLYVYTGQNGSFDLYEDENVNYNYEKGLYATITVSYNDRTKVLTIGKRKGIYAGMPEQRIFQINTIKKLLPAALDFNRKPDKTVNYAGEEVSVIIE